MVKIRAPILSGKKKTADLSCFKKGIGSFYLLKVA
jgi:hypothetical protein